MSTMTPPRARRTPKAPNRFSSDLSAADSNQDQSGTSVESSDDAPFAKHNLGQIGKIKLKPIVREPLKVKLPKLKRSQPAPQHTKEKQSTPKANNAEVKIHKIKLPSLVKKSVTTSEGVSAIAKSDCESTEKLKPKTKSKQAQPQPPKLISSPVKPNNDSRVFQTPSAEFNDRTHQVDATNASFSADTDTSSKGNTSLTSDDLDSSGMEIVIEKSNNQMNENGIKCPCGVNDDIGVMVECEKCSTWQHGHCINVGREEDAYEGYICFFCLAPKTDACKSLIQLTIGDRLQPFFDELELILRGSEETESHTMKDKCASLQEDDITKGVQDLRRVMCSLSVKWTLLTSQKYETEVRIWQNSIWNGRAQDLRTEDNSKSFYFIDNCKANLELNIRNMIEKSVFRCKVFVYAIECRRARKSPEPVDSDTSLSPKLRSTLQAVIQLRDEFADYKRRLKSFTQSQN